MNLSFIAGYIVAVLTTVSIGVGLFFSVVVSINYLMSHVFN